MSFPDTFSIARLAASVKNAGIIDRGGHGIGALEVQNGMIRNGETVEQCQLCDATKSARTCVFSAKPTDELLRCSETRKGKQRDASERGGVRGGGI